ncbi:MAG: TonB-dependent receptor [Acidobacteriota bacterium]|nr:TonB-dependent receptor [Acidobacteriota bacterium]
MKTEISFKTLLFFALVCAFTAISARSQSSATTASIIGSVRNSAGETISDALVTARDTATNQTRQTRTEADGSYRFSGLAVSTYEIRAESNGFAPYVNSQVTLSLGQTTTLDITLQPAGVNAEVIVTDKPPVIDGTQTASTTSIDPERIEELPVKSRNYLQFTLLAPGVAPSNTQSSSGGGNVSNSPLADSGFTFGGLRPRSNSISIDGLDNTDETTGAAMVALSPEIVREFQIINNGISAEFGGASGGAINVVTKTGANEFHGTLFNFFQNERLNARDALSSSDSKGRPRFRRYQPGASFGGAIVRDKLFFYAALEQENFTGDEQSEINDNVRTRINAALASGFAPRLAVRFLNGNRFRTGADETEAAGKLTYLLGSRNTLNFRFAFTNNRSRGEAFNTDALSDSTARGSSYTKDYQATGSAISVLTAKIINDFRLQFSTRRFISNAGDKNGTGIEIVGSARFGRPFDASGTRRENRQQFIDTISFTRGNQEWKAGASVSHVALASDLRDGFSGIYIFRNVEDFLAARPAIFRQAFGDSHTKFGVTNFGTFVQNRWQVLQNLTLNLGLRYDAEQLPKPFRTDKDNFSPRLGAAFNPSKEWVFRAGFGLFYDRLPLAFLNSAIQKNGAQAFEQIAFDEDAAQIFANTSGGQSLSPIPNIAPSIYRADPNFKTPYSIQTFAGVERLLTADTTVRAEFLFTRGVHLPRTRNVNLLLPVLLTTTNAASLGIQNPTAQQIGRAVFGTGRNDSRFDAVYQLEDSASSTYRGLTLTINKHLSNEFEVLASYTLSKAIDDASDFNAQPANPYDLRSERAASLQDARQRFVVSGVFELPFGDDEEKGSNKKESLTEEILSNIEIAPIITFSSGRPVNALTGSDEEREGTFPLASRPLGFPRNALRTPKFFNTDLRIVKYVPLSEKAKIDFAFEFFNLFNKPNVAAINQFYGSNLTALPAFKTPVLFNAPRQFRFSIDLEF